MPLLGLRAARRLGLLAAATVLLAPPAFSQQYRWVDDKGRVQYTDTPPPASAKSVQKKSLGETKAAAPDASAQLAGAAKRNPVTLYTSPNCETPCRDARNDLLKRGIPFKETIIFSEEAAAELQKAAGSRTVPAMLVGTVPQVGYNAGLWRKALDAAGYPESAPAGARAANPSRVEVKLFTNSNCGATCAEAREYLSSRKVAFSEVQVEDPASVDELRKLTGQQNVPVLLVGSLVQRGFDEALYGKALDSAGLSGTRK